MFQRHLGHVLLLWAVVVLPHIVLAENWPQFRGTGGLGVSQDKDLAVTWSDTENLAWKTALPGYGASSPIALNGKLYITCYSGYATGQTRGSIEDLRLHVVCVDANKGAIVWDKKIKPILPESSRVRDHGYATATPVTDGEYLYVFFGKRVS